jgi:hypothetical protein
MPHAINRANHNHARIVVCHATHTPSTNPPVHSPSSNPRLHGMRASANAREAEAGIASFPSYRRAERIRETVITVLNITVSGVTRIRFARFALRADIRVSRFALCATRETVTGERDARNRYRYRDAPTSGFAGKPLPAYRNRYRSLQLVDRSR